MPSRQLRRARPGGDTSDHEPRKVFRQPQSMVLGIAVIAVCALFLVLGLRSASSLRLVDVAWPIAVSLVAWALFVRPCVVLDQRGVTLRNLVRDAHVPWSRVEDTESHWNLKVFTPEGASYGSWAIATQRPRSPRVQRMGGFGLGPAGGRSEEIDTAALMNPTQRPQSAGAVAGEIERGVLDYRRAVADGQLPATEAPARRAPAWPGIAALGGAVVLLVAGILL